MCVCECVYIEFEQRQFTFIIIYHNFIFIHSKWLLCLQNNLCFIYWSLIQFLLKHIIVLFEPHSLVNNLVKTMFTNYMLIINIISPIENISYEFKFSAFSIYFWFQIQILKQKLWTNIFYTINNFGLSKNCQNLV